MKLTERMKRVLRVFLADPAVPRYGLEIAQETGMVAPSAYTTLTRLESEGLINSEREASVPPGESRPPRTYYRLTTAGIRAGQELDSAPTLDQQAWALAQELRRKRRP